MSEISVVIAFDTNMLVRALIADHADQVAVVDLVLWPDEQSSSRLLGEHGLLGIAIMVLLGWMLLRRYLGNPPGLGRAMSAAMAVWALSMMFHSATRVAAIPFARALVLVAWKIEEERQPAEPQPAPLFGARPGRLR